MPVQTDTWKSKSKQANYTFPEYFSTCSLLFQRKRSSDDPSAVPGIPVTPGATVQPPAGEGGSNVVRKRQKTSSDPESDASESESNTGPLKTKFYVSE